MQAEVRRNQHLSSAMFRIRFRYTADLEWPVQICTSMRASTFLMLSKQDFSRGGGMSSVPWCFLVLCQASLTLRNVSEI
jgi:hypothetical protein